VCSTTTARIARICAAIEDLAGRPEEGAGVSVPATAAARPGEAAETGGAGRAAVAGGAPGLATPGAADDAAERLAAIWAMIADVDPELAKRLPGYLAADE
jgi:hypothetical protein